MSELKLQQCRLDGRYDILECLGRGSYAEVYLARDSAAAGGSPQTVVIKALNIFLQGSIDLELERTLIENFRNEAIALDRVRHPNVINRLGHGTAIDLNGQTFHYLVLEYLSGGTMSDMCRHSPLSIERALFYLDQVASGLQHAHEKGVIHRDIKPQNLLLTSDRQVVKIADFGVAKLEASEGGITRVGTDVYAAPEHHPLLQTGPLDPHLSDAQSSRILTPAADVYSLAKTSYMLLTGDAPRRFAQKAITELPEEFAGRPWAAVAVRVLRRATETNPSRRPQTVREFWSELSDALMPKTQLLSQVAPGELRPHAPEGGRRGDGPGLPPEPLPVSFEPSARPRRQPDAASPARPRIVVPVARPQAEAEAAPAPALPARQPAHGESQTPAPREARPPQPARADKPAAPAPRGWLVRDKTLRLLIGLLIIAGFALLLYGVYASVSSRRQTSAPPPARQQTAAQPAAQGLQAGREMITTTNVNLRGGPGRTHERIGEVETGSRVRIRAVEGNWVEVDIIERGFPRRDEDGPARGWLDGTRLR
ncbi:MAG: protein kinase [Acidobacteria bacterium]|nr:protein kinase [Acidobacteriota bacterium]